MALGALGLRFPVFGGLGRSELAFFNVSVPLTLSRYACAAKRSSDLKVGFFFMWYFMGPGPGGEPLKEGYSTLDTDTDL